MRNFDARTYQYDHLYLQSRALHTLEKGQFVISLLLLCS